MRSVLVFAVLVSLVLLTSLNACGDWTGFRGGPERTSSTEYNLTTPLGIEWTFTGNGDMRTPLWAGDTVYVASWSKRIYAVNMSTGEMRWTLQVDDYLDIPMEIAGGRLYAAYGRVVQNVSLENGSRERIRLDGEIELAPILLDGDLYLANRTHVLVLRNDTVVRTFEADGGKSHMATDGVRVYLRSNGDIVHINGTSNASHHLTGTNGLPALSEGHVFVISSHYLLVFDRDLDLLETLDIGVEARGPAIADILVYVHETNVTARSTGNLSHLWTAKVSSTITTSPLLFGNAVAVGTKTGVAVIALNGTVIQELDLDDEILGCLAPIDGGILAASRGNRLYKITVDRDNDSVADRADAFPDDSTQWSDADGDGYGDNPEGTSPDAFPGDPTQWNDTDGDGYGDNPEGTSPDAFPQDPTQWSDTDGDGYGDNPEGTSPDAFPQDPTQWSDRDGDGHGDNPNGTSPDAFPKDATQWSDRDGDGHGDNLSGLRPDLFPDDPTQWADSDDDGYGDNPNGTNGDAFPFDPTQWNDTDGDGHGDNPLGLHADMFPDDPTQWSDADGDGYGDNPEGTSPDAFPGDPTQWNDTDGDGYGDNPEGTSPDAFPQDPTQWSDRDGDGHGDNPLGLHADMFPDDPTQWSDSDGDGYGDNPEGTSPDAFPDDASEWRDSDGDGVGDNSDPMPHDADDDGVNDTRDAFPHDPAASVDGDGDGYPDEWNEGHDRSSSTTGLTLDLFPGDPTQWADSDGDGHGDNPEGFSGDAFPGDPDEWHDADLDGVGDNGDAFPFDPHEWADTDGDGIGDNSDTYPEDRDNDGHPDGEDAFPDDPDEWRDSDGDGIGDNADRIPVNDIYLGYSLIALAVVLLVVSLTIHGRRREVAHPPPRRPPAARPTRPHGAPYRPPVAGVSVRASSAKARAPHAPPLATDGRRVPHGHPRTVAPAPGRPPATGPARRPSRVGPADPSEVYRRYRDHLTNLMEMMHERGVASGRVAALAREARSGPIENRVDALSQAVAEAHRSLTSFEVGITLSSELRMTARDLADRGISTGVMLAEADEAERLVREGRYRGAFRIMSPLIPHLRRLRRLPRGSVLSPDVVERMVRSRNTLAGGDAGATMDLLSDALRPREVERKGDLLVVRDVEPWGIDLSKASRAVRPEDLDEAAVHLALHGLRRVYVFSGIGFTPEALRKADDLRVIRPMGINEAMHLIWSDRWGEDAGPGAGGGMRAAGGSSDDGPRPGPTGP